MPVYAVRCVLTGKQPNRLAAETVSSAEPMTVGELLDHLVRSGALEAPRGHDAPLVHQFLVLVNGRSVHSLEAQDTPLADGDTISVLLPVAGG